MLLVFVLSVLTMFLSVSIDLFLSKIFVPDKRFFEQTVLRNRSSIPINQNRETDLREECQQMLINICKAGHLYCGEREGAWRFLTDLGQRNRLSALRNASARMVFDCQDLQSSQRGLYINSAVGRLAECDAYMYDFSDVNFVNVAEPCGIGEFLTTGGVR